MWKTKRLRKGENGFHRMVSKTPSAVEKGLLKWPFQPGTLVAGHKKDIVISKGLYDYSKSSPVYKKGWLSSDSISPTKSPYRI